MYAESKNMKALHYRVLIEQLEGMGCLDIKTTPVPFEAVEEHKEEEAKNTENDTEYLSIDEDQMILIAQKCFNAIAQKLAQKGITIQELYKDKVIKKTFEGEDLELLSQLDFINGIQSLELEGMQPLQYACLIQILAINDEEKHVKIGDLMQILSDYGVNNKEEEKNENLGIEQKKEPIFEELDKVSMVLLLALN